MSCRAAAAAGAGGVAVGVAVAVAAVASTSACRRVDELDLEVQRVPELRRWGSDDDEALSVISQSAVHGVHEG